MGEYWILEKFNRKTQKWEFGTAAWYTEAEARDVWEIIERECKDRVYRIMRYVSTNQMISLASVVGDPS